MKMVTFKGSLRAVSNISRPEKYKKSETNEVKFPVQCGISELAVENFSQSHIRVLKHDISVTTDFRGMIYGVKKDFFTTDSLSAMTFFDVFFSYS